MTVLVRCLAAVVGVLVGGAAYVVASGTVAAKECNVTEVVVDDNGCLVGHAFLEGYGKLVAECRPGVEVVVGVAQCHLRNGHLYIGAPWDATGVVVILGMLSAICLLGAVLGGDPAA